MLLRERRRDVRKNLAERLRHAMRGEVGLLRVLGRLLVVLVVGGAYGGDLLLPALDVHLEDLLQVGLDDMELRLLVVVGEVDVLGERDVADRGLVGLDLALDALADPLEDAAVVAKARPHEAAVFALAEPVHEVDLRELRRIGRGALHLQPVLEVVRDVVAEERKHRHRVAADLADLVGELTLLAVCACGSMPDTEILPAV